MKKYLGNCHTTMSIRTPIMSRKSLNEFQQRHLLTSVRHVDQLLSEIEQILNSPSSSLLFREYVPDITTAQAKVVEDYIARIRAQMLCVLESQNISPPRPRLGVINSIRAYLISVSIAVSELKPRSMKGYGELPEPVILSLSTPVAELTTLVDELMSYLAEIQRKVAAQEQ